MSDTNPVTVYYGDRSGWASDLELRRAIWWRDHHHLISPWGYDATTIKRANDRLLRRQWDRCTPK